MSTSQVSKRKYDHVTQGPQPIDMETGEFLGRAWLMDTEERQDELKAEKRGLAERIFSILIGLLGYEIRR